MNPDPDNNHHKPTGDECELCGFMKPDFRGDEDNVDRNSRELRGMKESGGSSIYNPTFRQQEPRRYENHAKSSFNVKYLGPVWIQEEIKRLFPEARKPGKLSC
jgi:hypothetical protein